ncbi:type II toxin-antitoxin system CcdA family antitoxin [Sulfurisphaera javensis]|uniref:Type II toxin-antitoxin system CcdA family antitoxin n=1 Tax=Sulfurisphaera javensis TaxID=2049879 RepID=A0AAT9GPR7_9CREN
MSWVTISTKVRRDLWEKAKKYNINISEVLRRALEEEIKEKEKEEARKSALIISKELNLSSQEIVKIIREIRDEKT